MAHYRFQPSPIEHKTLTIKAYHPISLSFFPSFTGRRTAGTFVWLLLQLSHSHRFLLVRARGGSEGTRSASARRRRGEPGLRAPGGGEARRDLPEGTVAAAGGRTAATARRRAGKRNGGSALAECMDGVEIDLKQKR